MNTEIAFETGPFAVTQEIWEAASDFLGIDRSQSTTQIKRISQNQIQIIQSEDIGQRNPFGSSAFVKTEIIAEFLGQPQGNKRVWRKK